MEWYLKVVRDNYSNFDGRATRQEYWMFYLFNIIFCIVAVAVDNILGTDFKMGGGYGYEASMGYGWIYALYALAVFLPSVGVSIRRLHDVGKSGWMLLIIFIPCIGIFWLLYLLVQDSSPLDNDYGPSPKPKPVSNEAAKTESENNDVEKDDDSSGEAEESDEGE